MCQDPVSTPTINKIKAFMIKQANKECKKNSQKCKGKSKNIVDDVRE